MSKESLRAPLSLGLLYGILLSTSAGLLFAASPSGAAPGAKVKVKNGAGATLFALAPSDKGFQVEADGGKKLGSVKVEADRVKVANAAGQPAFKVKQKGSGFKLYREPAQAGGSDIEIAEYSQEGAGFRVKDAGERELYRGKPEGGVLKVTGPNGQSFRIKRKADAVEVEDAGGKRLVRVEGLSAPAAAVFCAAPQFDTLQKAAVTAYSMRAGR